MTPYQTFSRPQWREHRHDTPLTLTEEELAELRGFNESVSIAEVEDIYLPLSRLISMYVAQSQSLYTTTNHFLGQEPVKVPYIIGISGSVAVGKSTTSRILQSLLSRWSEHHKVALVTTDGFLYPNAELEKQNLMNKKGFPQSYDRAALLKFLTSMKSGEASLSIPTYSHRIYDVTGETQEIQRPDILLVEGLNIMQIAKSNDPNQVYVSDFIDFNIFVDAAPDTIENWYMDRFMAFRRHAQDKSELYFYQFTKMSDEQAYAYGKNIWDTINAPNLIQNILPYKYRADLILSKDAEHQIQEVKLRRL